MLAKRRKVLVISGAHEQKWKKITPECEKNTKNQTSPECVELEVIPKR